jgi:hypothetical protein
VNLSNSFNLCISSLRLINGLLRLSAVVLALLVIETIPTNIEAENLRRTERSVLLAREKYEVDKVLEIDDKVKELKKTHERFLDLASRNRGPIHLLVLHEKYEKHQECQIKDHNAYFAF